MPFTETHSTFFDTTYGFGTAATWTPVAGGGPFTIQVIFDNAFEHFELGEAGQGGREPQFLVAESQIAQAGGMQVDDPVVINSVNYTVASEPEHDGTGQSLVRLRTT